MNKELQPLEEVVGAALTRMEDALSRRILETDMPDDLPLVSVDAVMMEQVFLNLLDNAIKYTKDGDRIRLEAKADGAQVLIRIQDNGPGIRDGDESKIFEKFFRGSDTKRSAYGAGLGLAICRGIIEAHGGRIWAEAAVPAGASLCFTLPAQSSPADNGGMHAE
jgi:two-component system sensor histidine kinase KdpD